MPYIYAMSDIHEHLLLFEDTLKLVDLSGKNQLVLLGDYIDIHTLDLSILYFIKELQEQYKEKIVVLAGNHELLFLEDIQSQTISFDDITLIHWLQSLPFYYETATQVYVHAGVDEEAGELWKWGSEDYYYCNKYPHTTGTFYKDIIAGHISTSTITGKHDYHSVYWDKESHFYIDGDTRVSKIIPVLKYDTDSGQYSSFEKIELDDGTFIWHEYVIKKGK